MPCSAWPKAGTDRLVQEFIRGKEAIYFLADRIAETRTAYFGECKWTGK